MPNALTTARISDYLGIHSHPTAPLFNTQLPALRLKPDNNMDKNVEGRPASRFSIRADVKVALPLLRELNPDEYLRNEEIAFLRGCSSHTAILTPRVGGKPVRFAPHS